MMNLNSLLTLGIVFLVGGLLFGVSAITQGELLDDIDTDYGNDSIAYGVVNNTLDGTSNASGQFPLIGTIAGLLVLVGLVLGAFGIRNMIQPA